MQLNLKTRTVRFEMVDDESETTITLSSEDDQETICRKLRKVLSLADPERCTSAAWEPGTQVQAAREGVATALLSKVAPSTKSLMAVGAGNGWKKYEAPQVPDRLQGEVELIDPEVTSGEQ